MTLVPLLVLQSLYSSFNRQLSSELSGTTWFNLSAVQLGSVAMHGAPLYIAETCPSKIRGTLISLKEQFIALGILLGYFVGSFRINAVGGWRCMSGCSAPIALLMGLGMWSLPPSPRWLLLRAVQGKGSLQENKEKAILALRKLRGRASSDEASEKRIEDTLISVKSAYMDQESEGNILEMTGQPSVLYHAGPILQSAGFSVSADATRLSVVVAVVKVDDVGRRPLLIGGVGGIALSLLLLSAYSKFLGGLPFVAELLGAENLFLLLGASVITSVCGTICPRGKRFELGRN
ncbi:hypothetical protein PTKIN_Ptkin03bG0037400 [Pterospermum kingtungense]